MSEDGNRGVAAAVRNYGALAASVLQLVGVLLYVSHWQATVDQRLTAVEGQQARISQNMDRLDGAREADQVHLAHVDDRIGDMVSKVNAMFNIMTGSDAEPAPADEPAKPQGFPRPQGRKN